MVPPNQNSSQNSKANQNQQPNSDKPCTSTTPVPAIGAAGYSAAGSSQTIGGGHPGGGGSSYPSPTPSYCKSAIKKPKLAPPPEEEGSASSLCSYTSIRQPTPTGGTSTSSPLPPMHHTGPPAGAVTSSTTTSVVGTNGSSGTIATTNNTTSAEFSCSPSDYGTPNSVYSRISHLSKYDFFLPNLSCTKLTVHFHFPTLSLNFVRCPLRQLFPNRFFCSGCRRHPFPEKLAACPRQQRAFSVKLAVQMNLFGSRLKFTSLLHLPVTES